MGRVAAFFLLQSTKCKRSAECTLLHRGLRLLAVQSPVYGSDTTGLRAYMEST